MFVEIGLLPNSDFVKDLVALDAFGHVVVDHKTQQTSCPGIWAAGDVSDVLYDQNNISVGDSIKAVLNVYDKIKKSKKFLTLLKKNYYSKGVVPYELREISACCENSQFAAVFI